MKAISILARLTIFVALLLLTEAGNGQTTVNLFQAELLFSNPPFKQCHSSSIVETKSGKLLVACFAGSGEGKDDVGIWLTERTAAGWQPPTEIATGKVNDSLRYPCWNPVLFENSKGTLFLYYKVGPSPQKWWGMQKKSTDEGVTWSAAEALPEDILGPIKNKPLQVSNGTILSPSSVETADYWRAHVEMSTNDGASWKKIVFDSSTRYNTIQPSIIRFKGGKLQMLCRSKEGKIIESWSADEGKSWTPFGPTNLENPNSGIDAATSTNGIQLLVHNPGIPGKEWWEGRSKLILSSSTHGTSWRKLAQLEDHSKGEYSYPAIITGKNGDLHITYTYDRHNIKYVSITTKQLAEMIR